MSTQNAKLHSTKTQLALLKRNVLHAITGAFTSTY